MDYFDLAKHILAQNLLSLSGVSCERDDFVCVIEESVCERATDKAGGSGDEDTHPIAPKTGSLVCLENSLGYQ